MRKVLLFFCCALVAFSGSRLCAQGGAGVRSVAAAYPHLPPGVYAAMETINPDRIRAHVRFLASDLLEGRGTGQRGGDLAAEYIATQFALYGLKPAGDNGTYMQKVPLEGIATQDTSTITLIPTNGAPIDLVYRSEFVAMDETGNQRDDIDAPVV